MIEGRPPATVPAAELPDRAQLFPIVSVRLAIHPSSGRVGRAGTRESSDRAQAQVHRLESAGKPVIHHDEGTVLRHRDPDSHLDQLTFGDFDDRLAGLIALVPPFHDDPAIIGASRNFRGI